MRLRLALALVTVGLAATGMGCGGSEPDARPAEQRTTTQTMTSTEDGGAATRQDDATEDRNLSLSQQPPTEEEEEWVGLLVEWSHELGEPVEVAGIAAAAFGEGTALSTEDERVVTDAITGMELCADRFDDIVGDPPTVRLEGVAAAAHRACEAYAAAAAAARGIVEGTGARVPLLEEWEAEFTTADTAMSSAADAVNAYQPGNSIDLPVKSGITRSSRIEPVFGRVAGRVVDDDVQVRCWSRKDWRKLIREMERFTSGRITADTLGFVGFRDHRANIAPGVCEALVALHYGKLRPTAPRLQAMLALSVGVLAHEALHVSGVANEARAECLGMQLVETTAERLGVESSYAAGLAEVYARKIYPQAPPEYRSTACRNGGGLDVRPRVSAWP